MTMRRSRGELGDGGLEKAGVFAGGLGVVDRAGADEDEEARVELGENAA